ncbi:hypothetical protein KY319_04825 [Candidatus Woesearchaeota archaeon]|nr:hypothetical protein [Candidatus Woesearchaeota archaeon]
MKLNKWFVIGGLTLASLLGGCVTDDQYTKKDEPKYWQADYRGFPPKFMRDPGYVLPQYKRFK